MIGYLPEGVGFYASLNARQNLKYLSRFYDIKDADARIGELLSYVGLEKVDKPAGAFSRGMKQRLGLARALLNDPDVIFLDEPTNGLDPEGVISFRRILKEQAEKGKTVFFSSHILDEVEHVCNTICIISGGKIMAQGTVDDVRQKMRKGDHMKIVVKVAGAMPKLSNPGIIDATYHDGTATLSVQSDIVNEIAGELIKNNVRIRELKIEEESLEDIFLETVYRRE
jgi:ABC-2 type transport system ATP-binding protein